MHTRSHTHACTHTHMPASLLIQQAAHFAGQTKAKAFEIRFRIIVVESSTGRRFHSFNSSGSNNNDNNNFNKTTATTSRSYIFIAWHGAYESTANASTHTHTSPSPSPSQPNPFACENFLLLLLQPNKRAAKRMRWEKDCLRRKEIYFSDILT